MRRVLRLPKRIILKIQIRKCIRKIIRLEQKQEGYHDIIMDMIRKRVDMSEIEKVKLLRRSTHKEIMQLINKKWDYIEEYARA
jgi:hypothetical protein